MADGDELLSGPDLKREGAGAAADNGEGAVVQQMQWRHGTAAADPDQEGREELGRNLFLSFFLYIFHEWYRDYKIFIQYITETEMNG